MARGSANIVFCLVWTVLFCGQLFSPVFTNEVENADPVAEDSEQEGGPDDDDIGVVEDLTTDQFPDFVKQNQYVLALFFEPGCVSCVEAQDLIKDVFPSDIFPGSLKKAQITDINLAKSMGVKEFPALVFIRKGDPVVYDADKLEIGHVELWLDIAHEVGTKVLNDESFEHLTQASTGATTGDWLVAFYKDSCAEVTPIMESFAVRVRRTMNVAKVDMEGSPKLVKRLKVNKCPTVIFFRQGKMYRYEVEKYDTKSLTSFVDGWYKNMRAEKVPGESTGFDELTENIAKALKEQMQGPNRMVFLGIAGGLSALVVLIIVIACAVSRKNSQKKKLY